MYDAMLILCKIILCLCLHDGYMMATINVYDLVFQINCSPSFLAFVFWVIYLFILFVYLDTDPRCFASCDISFIEGARGN